MKLKLAITLLSLSLLALGVLAVDFFSLRNESQLAEDQILKIVSGSTPPNAHNLQIAKANYTHLQQELKPLHFFWADHTISPEAAIGSFAQAAKDSSVLLPDNYDFSLLNGSESNPLLQLQIPTTAFVLSKLFEAKPYKLLNIEYSRLSNASAINVSFLATTATFRKFLNACLQAPCICSIPALSISTQESWTQFNVTIHLLHEA